MTPTINTIKVRLRSLPLRLIWLSLLVVLLFSIVLTTYLTGTGRVVLETVRLGLPFHEDDSWPPPFPPPEEKPGVFQDEENPNGFQEGPEVVALTVPPGVRVIGLVFYGRKALVEVLDCYLKRNLKDNGGLLDEVIFAVRTDIEGDLEYLEELLQTSPRYSKHVAKGEYEWWVGSWEAVDEPDSIYIKIDDDIVFIDNNTIPAIVKRKLENPKYFAVSANVVNNPALSWVHYSMGVYEPYWPEMKKPRNPPPVSWRASELPPYKGPIEGPKDFEIDGSTPPPYEGHRWLPVRMPAGKDFDMSLSPASTLTYDAFGPSLKNWAAAAQTHYSFLQHLERGDTWRYKQFDTWDYAYERLSINFFAMRGKDIMDVFPFPQQDDEDYLTVVRPKEVRRHVVVDGTALAVHFAFKPQYDAHEGKGVRWTDALKRYGAYAKEMICLPPNRTATEWNA